MGDEQNVTVPSASPPKGKVDTPPVPMEAAKKKKVGDKIMVEYLGHFDRNHQTQMIRTEDGEFGLGSVFEIDRAKFNHLSGAGYKFNVHQSKD